MGFDWGRFYLLVFELDYFVVAFDDFVGFVFAFLEEFREGKPLTGHFVSVVGVDELIVIHAVWGVSFYPLDGWLHTV